VNLGAAHVSGVFTIGHGTRPAEEFIACLREAHVGTLVETGFTMSRRCGTDVSTSAGRWSRRRRKFRPVQFV
jgi:hypothetical protein